MKILVTGATGCVGHAVGRALRSRGHKVVEAGRGFGDTPNSMHLDYAQPVEPAAWARRLRMLQVDAVVNCVGILMPSRGQTFERVHTQGPIELFRGAALAGVTRVVQVSALGVDGSAHCLDTPYLRSKLLADDALAALPVDWAVLRPSLVYGPRSQSAALFATLASLPLISLPGRGGQQVQPLHVYELAEAVARLIEQPGAMGAVHELGGAEPISYRRMLAAYREALGLGPALWMPLPLPLMRLTAHLAEALPQKVFCRDTIGMLERGSVPAANDLPQLLGRAPSLLAHGLGITRPQPMLDLDVRLSPALDLLLRSSLAFMWVYIALVSLLWPQESGVMRLLAQCGMAGTLGLFMWGASSALNIGLGLSTLFRPGPWAYLLQACAVIGYTATAAFHVPSLTIDHCGPLAKNLPMLALIALLWLAHRAPAERPTAQARRTQQPRSAWT